VGVKAISVNLGATALQVKHWCPSVRQGCPPPRLRAGPEPRLPRWGWGGAAIGWQLRFWGRSRAGRGAL